jgi:uncharacterized OB-fold protein
MGDKSIELIGSDCQECGEEKFVAVSIASYCKECGLDSLLLKYEIPKEKVKDIFLAIFRILDGNELKPIESEIGIITYEELMKRLKM